MFEIGQKVETTFSYQLKQLGKWGTLYYTGIVTGIKDNIVTVDHEKQFLNEDLKEVI